MIIPGLWMEVVQLTSLSHINAGHRLLDLSTLILLFRFVGYELHRVRYAQKTTINAPNIAAILVASLLSPASIAQGR